MALSNNNNLITYVPNTWYSSDKINEDNSNYECMDLCYDGYMFKRHRINKNSINWLCKTNGCNSSVTITRDEKISRFVEHKGDIQHNLVDEQKKLRLKFNMDCKIRSETEPHISVGKIYLEEQSKIAQNSNLSYKELSKIIDPYYCMKSTLTKRKKKNCPKLSKSLKDMIIPDEYKVNQENEKFLIYNKDNKILVFASPTQLKALAQATHWYADGTFRKKKIKHYQ